MIIIQLQSYTFLHKLPNIFEEKKEKILARTRTYYVLYKIYSMYIYNMVLWFLEFSFVTC